MLKTPLHRLAQRLLEKQLLSQKVLDELLIEAKNQQLPLVTYLLKKPSIPFEPLAMIIAEDFGLPFIDLDTLDKTHIPIHLVHEKLIQKHLALPLWQKDKKVGLAIADPTQQNGLNEIQFQTGLAVQCAIVAKDKLTLLIEELLITQQTSLGNLKEIFLPADATPEQHIITTALTGTENDAPIIRYVNKILMNAIHKRASDIHFEPFENAFYIRFRIDGLLYPTTELPPQHANRIIARLKIMSQLDIAERRIPQDGRFKITLSNNQTVDFRLSTCPTLHGEKIVVRILDANRVALDVDNLGFTSAQQSIFLQALKKPQGMILVTGPTGSGKTVTLYTALNILNTSSVNIATVEDPVEIYLPGINQVNINPKAGLDFSNTLRAFLRQDPDILMVGEIRDLETAEIGIKAAQTGHLVLSTLHTNSAIETLSRLVNMGIPHYNLATSTTLIIAQRLVRKLCEHCKTKTILPENILLQAGFSTEEISTLTTFKPKGCKHCTQGYKGRIGIFELLLISESIAELIMRGEQAFNVAAQAQRENMQMLRMSALEKIRNGVTSLQEIHRVIKD